MSLTSIDRELWQNCLAKNPGAWNDFVDRYLSLVYHVIHSTAHLRSARITPEDVEDIAAEVLLQIVADDYKVLRQFKGQSSLTTYLTVIARRICVHELNRRQAVKDEIRTGTVTTNDIPDDSPAAVKGVESLEEVERLLRKLAGKDREVVRLFYLEGRSYEEISTELNLPVNTIGSLLTRARKKLREMAPAATGTSTMEIRSLKSMAQAEINSSNRKK